MKGTRLWRHIRELVSNMSGMLLLNCALWDRKHLRISADRWLALEIILLMCSLKRRSVSIVIPKSVTEFTFCMGMLLIWMDCDVCEDVIFGVWNLHLPYGGPDVYLFKFVNICKLFWVWLMKSVYNLMSSAKSLTVVGLKWSVISFTNNWIVNFQSHYPGITPLVTVNYYRFIYRNCLKQLQKPVEIVFKCTIFLWYITINYIFNIYYLFGNLLELITELITIIWFIE